MTFARRGANIVVLSTSLSSINAPWKNVLGKIEKKTVYFEHISAHPHLPMQTLPVGTSKCEQGVSACTQKHEVRLSKPDATDLGVSRRHTLPCSFFTM